MKQGLYEKGQGGDIDTPTLDRQINAFFNFKK